MRVGLWNKKLSFICFIVLLSVFGALSEKTQKQEDNSKLIEQLKKCDTKADVIFMLDSSNSVGERNFRRQLEGISKLIELMTDGHKNDQFRFGIVTYSTKADMVMSLKDFAGQPSAAAKFVLTAVEYKPGQAGIGEGLKLIEMVGFDSDSGARPEAEKIVIMVADTQANTETKPGKTGYNLRQKKITILALGIGKEIDEKYLEQITHDKKMVVMVSQFNLISSANKELMGMVCHHFRKEPAVEKPKPCPEGQKLVNNECENMKPTCKKACPKDYVLIYPCQCIVEVGKCPFQCPKGKINNKKCECVLEHPPKCLLKKCPPNYTLNKAKCECECQKICTQNLFTLDSARCECVCNSKCREDYILNTKKCICEKIHCGSGYILYHGKCRNDISRICKPGQILFKDTCLNQRDCPNGFVNKLGICMPKCPGGIDDDGNCRNTCKHGHFLLNGKCQEVTQLKCSGPAHFAVPAPMCPSTCEEPIPLTKCAVKGEPKPGCVCDQGFFLLKGKCVRASQCPNKPVCLKQVDMLFMLDSSVNVGEPNFFMMKSLVHSIVQEFDTKDGQQQRVSVVAFNEKVNEVIQFKDYLKMTHEDMLKDILEIPYKPGDSYLGEAIHYARSHIFTRLNGMREDVPRMVLLLTRGNPSGGTLDASWEARKMREAGISLVVIGIGENIESKTENLYDLTGKGDKVFVFALRKLRQIHEIVSRIVATRCDNFVCPRPRVIRKECKNEYQQLDRVEFYTDGFKCQKNLVKNWKRVRCSCPKARTVKTACIGLFREIIKYEYILDKKSLVCHEHSQRLKIRCKCPTIKKEVSGCTDMIRRTKFTYFKLVSGGPHGFRCEPQYSWKSSRCDCPSREITHGPCKNNFRVKKITVYNLIQGHCVSEVSTTEIQCACPRPKIHTSACDGTHVAVKVQVEALNKDNHCDKEIFVGFKPCKQSCKNEMDVAFLIDTSKSLDYTSFPTVRAFLSAMVQSLPMSRVGTHVALGRFSSTQKMALLFDFFTFYKNDQAIARINDMRFHPGSSSTAEGIQMMRLTAFSSSHGTRPDVARVMYMITDTESNGDQNVIIEAKKLRGMGVQIVAIGVGPHVEPGYLQKLASRPHSVNVFIVRDYDTLMSIKDQALESRCNAPGTVNHISVMNSINAKLREINAIGGQDYSSLGLTQLNVNEMAELGFSVKSYFSVVAGTQEWQQEKFREAMVSAIAKALNCKIFEIVDFKTVPGSAESKEIRVHFKLDRKYGPAIVKLLKDKKLQFLSINKKPLPAPEALAYISPYAVKGFEYTQDTMGCLREIGDETILLMKLQKGDEHLVLDQKIHLLNLQLSKAKAFYHTNQANLVKGCQAAAKGAVNLAKETIHLAKTHAASELERKDITTWEVHKANRHLKNIHDLIAELAAKAKLADEALKTAELDDVMNGKVLPAKSGEKVEAGTKAAKATVVPAKATTPLAKH